MGTLPLVTETDDEIGKPSQSIISLQYAVCIPFSVVL